MITKRINGALVDPGLEATRRMLVFFLPYSYSCGAGVSNAFCPMCWVNGRAGPWARLGPWTPLLAPPLLPDPVPTVPTLGCLPRAVPYTLHTPASLGPALHVAAVSAMSYVCLRVYQ